MNLPIALAFLFFVGSCFGWVLELFFRRFLSKRNPEKKWINPGFCTGPYVPLYGFGLCVLFLLTSVDGKVLIEDSIWGEVILFSASAVAMTALEYAAGIFCLKVMNVRLWDYSSEWGNVQGIICPKFSLAWAVLCAVYAYLVHPHILHALTWLSNNLAFSFFIGLFFGVFIIDFANSAQLIVKLRKFANDNDVIVHYENIKTHIRMVQDHASQKAHFFRPFRSEQPLSEHLKEMISTFEARKHSN